MSCYVNVFILFFYLHKETNNTGVFLPSFGHSDMYRKRVQICVSLLVFLGLLSTLAVLFYVYPVKCDWCEYLTCIPITDKFCEKYDLNAHLL